MTSPNLRSWVPISIILSSQSGMASAQGYAESLSEYAEKGKLNLQNSPDSAPAVLEKSRYLAELIKKSNHIVVHTGAGISTSAGISDFRGPNGVWTTEKRPSKRPRRSVPFHRAIPTITHMVIAALYKKRYVDYVVSQNVDALHSRSGLPRNALSELHGNIFVEYCPSCDTEYLREHPAPTVGLRRTGNKCACGGDLHDRALDWEDALPEKDFEEAKIQSAKADLNIVLGTSCQMEPARLIPFRGKGGKASVVLVNLSETPFDDRFGFRIHAKCDDVFAIVARALNLKLEVFERRIGVELEKASIDSELFRYSLKRNDGGFVDGVQAIRYGDVEGQGENFVAIGKSVVKAVAEFEDGRIQEIATDGDDVEIVIDQKDWNEEVLRLANSVTMEARLYEGSIETSEYFVSGRRRGWSVCCICRREVWCGHGKRDAHIRECLRRRAS